MLSEELGELLPVPNRRRRPHLQRRKKLPRLLQLLMMMLIFLEMKKRLR
jgi:hypothetical protein